MRAIIVGYAPGVPCGARGSPSISRCPRFDLEQTRLDLRGYLAELDPARATVWVEVLPAEPRLPRFKAMLAEQLLRAGFHPSALPPGLAPGQIAPYRGER